MQQYLNFDQFCYCRHFKWPSVSPMASNGLPFLNLPVFCYSPPLERFCWPESNISNHYANRNLYLQNNIIGTQIERKNLSESSWKKLAIAFVMPSLAAIDLYAGAFLEECKFDIIYVGHLPQMVHDIGFIVNH